MWLPRCKVGERKSRSLCRRPPSRTFAWNSAAFFCHPRGFSVIHSGLQGQPAFTLKRSVAWADIQSDEDAQGVRHVSEDLLDRLRKLSHQRGDGQDLVPCGKVGVLQEVDYLDPVHAGKVRLTDFFQVGEGVEGLDGLPRYIKVEFVLYFFWFSSPFPRFFFPDPGSVFHIVPAPALPPALYRVFVLSSAWRSFASSFRVSILAFPCFFSIFSVPVTSSSTVANSASSETIRASFSRRFCSRSHFLRPISSRRLTASISSSSAWATLEAPMRTAPEDRETFRSRIPLSVSRNSRIWLEWDMARDFRTKSPRLCSPLDSMSFTWIQVSMSEEIPTPEVSSFTSLMKRLVKRIVILWAL